MVEYVLIETHYNGSEFAISISDKPMKKAEMVKCAFEILNGYGKIAVKNFFQFVDKKDCLRYKIYTAFTMSMD